MSYCRVNQGSDVYAYQGIDDAGKPLYVCCGCLLPENAALKAAFETAGEGLGGPAFEAPGQLLEHLLRHRGAGHKVPEAALERLSAEAKSP